MGRAVVTLLIIATLRGAAEVSHGYPKGLTKDIIEEQSARMKDDLQGAPDLTSLRLTPAEGSLVQDIQSKRSFSRRSKIAAVSLLLSGVVLSLASALVLFGTDGRASRLAPGGLSLGIASMLGSALPGTLSKVADAQYARGNDELTGALRKRLDRNRKHDLLTKLSKHAVVKEDGKLVSGPSRLNPTSLLGEFDRDTS